MERHIVCVWDFMCLLKSLQRDLTGTAMPWVPPVDSQAARLINEMVLDEESDQMADGQYGSHFELYRRAMQEVGANVEPIDRLLSALRDGADPETALSVSEMPPENQAFVRTTLELLETPLHVRAAVFFHGREDIIPSMFIHLVESLNQQDGSCEAMLDYLQRHIETDSERHGPASRQVMERLIGEDPEKEQAALNGSLIALDARLALWDEIVLAIQPSQ